MTFLFNIGMVLVVSRTLRNRKGPPHMARTKASYEEHKEFARKHGILELQTWANYANINSQFHKDPSKAFPKEFEGWDTFFGRSKKSNGSSHTPTPCNTKTQAHCYSYEEARERVGELGIQNMFEYRLKYKTDPHLPANPRTFYKHRWIDGYDFFQEACPSIDDLLEFMEMHHIVSLGGLKSMGIRHPGFGIPRTPLRFYRKHDADTLREYLIKNRKKPLKKNSSTTEHDEAIELTKQWFEKKRVRNAANMAFQSMRT